MKRILFINSVCYGSTGRICLDLYKLAEENGYECCIAYGRGEAPNGYKTIKIGNEFDVYAHVAKTRLFDEHGFGSKKATTLFLKQIELYKPDIIHLHNIHGYYINIELLFIYLKQHKEIKVIWTLHDCWTFTGHCSNFIYSQCDKWENECYKCPEIRSYPQNIIYSNVSLNFKRKKQLFTNLENLILVTPSVWLNNLIKKSFLKNYESLVIHNGIDLSTFRIKKNRIQSNKLIILGVANVWNQRKGLDTFLELSRENVENLQIVLVGLTKKQMKNLPSNVIGIGKTNNIEELVDLYNRADVLFNPTLEDNYPTVNLEAQACGTPVITFDAGGAKETLYSNNSFTIENLQDFLKLIKMNDFKQLKKFFICNTNEIDKNIKLKEYIVLYDKILGKG